MALSKKRSSSKKTMKRSSSKKGKRTRIKVRRTRVKGKRTKINRKRPRVNKNKSRKTKKRIMKGGNTQDFKIKIIYNRKYINLNKEDYNIQINVEQDIETISFNTTGDIQKTYKTLNSTKKGELKNIINQFVINRIRKTEFNINNIIVNEQQSTIDVYVS
tara:strand:- start:194 stop:673 length:480 start_codon:yes stop_codon:yes gene_type:complete